MLTPQEFLVGKALLMATDVVSAHADPISL